MGNKKAPPTRLVKKNRGRIVKVEEQNPASANVQGLAKDLAKRKKRAKKK